MRKRASSALVLLFAAMALVSFGPSVNVRGAEEVEPTFIEGRPAWRHTPISVQWDPKVWGKYNAVIEKALAAFPCGFFVKYDPEGAHKGRMPDAIIRLNHKDATGCGTKQPALNEKVFAAVAWACAARPAEIWVARAAPLRWDEEEIYILMVHELGHVAGLEHDPKREVGYKGEISIMTPDVMNHSGRAAKGLPVPALTEKDISALSDRYCYHEEKQP